MRIIPDSELIQSLQFGDNSSVNVALTHLHRQLYRKVLKYINKHRGTSHDAEDIFQDGLLALYKLARRDAINENTDIEAYLFTICKNLWLQKLRKKQTILNIEEEGSSLEIEQVELFSLIKKEEQAELKRMMNQLGESCRKVLTLYYYKRIRMREIAEIMNYSSDQVAKNRKSECMKKLKKLMMESPFFKNRFH